MFRVPQGSRPHGHGRSVLFLLEEINWELKRLYTYIYGCRCNERLIPKVEESKLLVYTEIKIHNSDVLKQGHLSSFFPTLIDLIIGFLVLIDNQDFWYIWLKIKSFDYFVYNTKILPS